MSREESKPKSPTLERIEFYARLHSKSGKKDEPRYGISIPKKVVERYLEKLEYVYENQIPIKVIIEIPEV